MLQCVRQAERRHRNLADGPKRKNKDFKKEHIMVKTITEKLNAWLRYREAVKELSRLSDRELSDIGVRRGDIEFIARRQLAA
jgi:uncharacterized protein YjiS (DUF1127 family)